MLPVGSLGNLLRAIVEQTAHGLLTVDPPGGQGRSGRNAAQAAAEASAERCEREAVSSSPADHDTPRSPQGPRSGHEPPEKTAPHWLPASDSPCTRPG
jgi:hypothetical protein